jgi:uncharacterized membrane protein
VTTADHVAAGWPRRGVLIALLVVSVALNVCFIGGALWTRIHAPPPPLDMAERYNRMRAELDLNPQQRAAFDKYAVAMHDRTQKMHEQIAPLIGDAWEEIAHPQADAAQIMRLFNQASEDRRDYQRDITVQTLSFLATLSPEQRSKFVAIGRERRPLWMRSHPANH